MGCAFITSSAQQTPSSGGMILGPLWKLAVIWFDELLVEWNVAGLRNSVLPRAIDAGEMSVDIADRFGALCTDAYGFIDTSVLLPWVIDSPGRNVLNHAIDFVAQCNIPSGDSGKSAADHFAYLRAAVSLATWHSLNANRTCSLLATPIEDNVISKVTAAASEANGFHLFHEVSTVRIPDLTSLPWDRVLEIREHPHAESFRARMRRLAADIHGGEYSDSIEAFEEIERRDLREIARLCQPAPLSALFRMITGNIPLPLPVNPISLWIGAREVRRERRMQETFGWIYFLMDIEGL